MSSGVEPHQVAGLRAMAHPLRLRLLSLLTGTAMSAAEVARELDLTHANASYHLRQLYAAGLLTVAEEESIRGGRAKRYRHDPAASRVTGSADPSGRRAIWSVVADELLRRASAQATGPGLRQHMTDAELWVDPEVWAGVVADITAASVKLHEAARPPRTPGTVQTSATIALFEMGPGAR